MDLNLRSLQAAERATLSPRKFGRFLADQIASDRHCSQDIVRIKTMRTSDVALLLGFYSDPGDSLLESLH